MKNKILAILAAAVVGVASFSLVMTAKADRWQDVCSICGEDSIIAEEIEYELRIVDETPCIHGYEREYEVCEQWWVLMRYYCGDCRVHWEKWASGSWPSWKCTHG